MYDMLSSSECNDPVEVVAISFRLYRTLPDPLPQAFRHLFRQLEHLQMSFRVRKLKLLDAFHEFGESSGARFMLGCGHGSWRRLGENQIRCSFVCSRSCTSPIPSPPRGGGCIGGEYL